MLPVCSVHQLRQQKSYGPVNTMQFVISVLLVSDFNNSMLKIVCGLFSLHHIIYIYICSLSKYFSSNPFISPSSTTPIFACRTLSDDIIELDLPVTYSLYLRAMNTVVDRAS